MQHKLIDLAAAVEALPPSAPGVTIDFIAKLIPHSVDGYVASDRVAEVVNNWPGACPDGKERFLKSVGAEEVAPVVVVGATYRHDSDYGDSPEQLAYETCADLAKYIPGVTKSVRTDGHGFERNTHATVELTIGNFQEFLAWIGTVGAFNKRIDIVNADITGTLSVTI